MRRRANEHGSTSLLDRDDTSDIVNIQEYYRSVFEHGWDNYRTNEKELYALLSALTSVAQQDVLSGDVNTVSLQESAKEALELGLHSKPIRGRYIIMFQSDADDYLLDRTIKVLERAHFESKGGIRASDMHPLRHVGKGLTVTLNSLALELVRVSTVL